MRGDPSGFLVHRLDRLTHYPVNTSIDIQHFFPSTDVFSKCSFVFILCFLAVYIHTNIDTCTCTISIKLIQVTALIIDSCSLIEDDDDDDNDEEE